MFDFPELQAERTEHLQKINEYLKFYVRFFRNFFRQKIICFSAEFLEKFLQENSAENPFSVEEKLRKSDGPRKLLVQDL
jgi:hypothetical protein